MSILKIGFQGKRTNRTYEVGNYCSGYKITEIYQNSITDEGTHGEVYHVMVDYPKVPVAVEAAIVMYNPENAVWSFIEYDLTDYHETYAQIENAQNTGSVFGLKLEYEQMLIISKTAQSLSKYNENDGDREYFEKVAGMTPEKYPGLRFFELFDNKEDMERFRKIYFEIGKEGNKEAIHAQMTGVIQASDGFFDPKD